MNRNEQVRNEILVQCYGYRPQPRDCERMARQARHDGEIQGATEFEFQTEAAYLVDKGFLREVRDALSNAHKRFTITSAGIDYLEGEGLV